MSFLYFGNHLTPSFTNFLMNDPMANILILNILCLSLTGSIFGEAFVLHHHPTPISRSERLFISTNSNDYGSGSQGDDHQPFSNEHSRREEFKILDTKDDSDVRRKRKQRESSQKQRFAAFGNDLWDLRDRILNLSNQLIDAVASKKDSVRIRNEIKEAEAQDAEAVYTMELEAMYKAIDEERDEDAKKHSERALFARDYLPQYNLEGKFVQRIEYIYVHLNRVLYLCLFQRLMDWEIRRWISVD